MKFSINYEIDTAGPLELLKFIQPTSLNYQTKQ